jgi:hypothetical protein
MPPYTPVKSKAQSRALFAAAARGEMSEDDAKGKTRAADWSELPERVKRSTAAARGEKPERPSQGRASQAARQKLRRVQRRGR